MRRVNFVDCFVWRSKKMTGGGISAAVACDFCERKSFDTYCRWIVFEAEERYGGDVLYLYWTCTCTCIVLVIVIVGTRDMTHDTSWPRFVSLPLKRGTATNAFPLRQNGPPLSQQYWSWWRWLSWSSCSWWSCSISNALDDDHVDSY